MMERNREPCPAPHPWQSRDAASACSRPAPPRPHLSSRPARAAAGKRLAYLTPGLDLPFWRTLAKGIEDTAKAQGGSSTTYDSHNSAQTQIQNAQDAIAKQVDGIIISPTDSSTAPAVLAAAKRANIPVVIADIGTTGGEYVSFIISDNEKGAYGVGQQLAAR